MIFFIEQFSFGDYFPRVYGGSFISRNYFMNKKQNNKRTTRIMVVGVKINGYFELATDFNTREEFEQVFVEWVYNTETIMQCAESLIFYIKEKCPNRICLLKEDFDEITKGKRIPATKEKWESENN
jgi:F0F1-type ATP synthase gamma subunit